MDRPTAHDLLANAEGCVIGDERKITRLRRVVIQLKRGGAATAVKLKTARELLRIIELIRSIHIAHRDRLSSLVNRLAHRDRLSSLVNRVDAERASVQRNR